MVDDKRTQIISMIRDTIRASEPTAQIILYGSRARGDAREDSDWDVLAIVDKPRLSLKDRSNLQYPLWDKGLEIGEEINVFPYTRKQWEQGPLTFFKHNVMTEGITIWVLTKKAEMQWLPIDRRRRIIEEYIPRVKELVEKLKNLVEDDI